MDNSDGAHARASGCRRPQALPTVVGKTISLLAVFTLVGACSTNGEFYHEGDAKNGEFSTWRTVMLPFAIAGVIAGAAAVGVAAAQPTYVDPAYAWRNPYTGQYYCRSSATGQFIPAYRCGG
jgi:hypothetical protein